MSSSFSRGSVSVERKKRPTSRSLPRRGDYERVERRGGEGRREGSLAAVREYSESGAEEEEDGTDGDDVDVDVDVDVTDELEAAGRWCAR